MIYIIAGVLTVLWIVAASMLIYKVLDAATNNSGNAALVYIIAGIFFSLSVAGIFYLEDSEEKKGPCVKYDIQMRHNPATKTMMPARVCVLRGEWAE